LTRSRVIVLNGPASSGKSSISAELVRLLEPAPLLTNIDTFLHMLPPVGHIDMEWRQRTNENAQWDRAYIRWVFPTDPSDGVRIELSDAGQRMIRGMHRAIAALADEGNSVIFEYVQLYPDWLEDLRVALDRHDAVYVGVHAPLDVIERWERRRGNRVVGQARGHYDVVHQNARYDIEIDTSQTSPLEAAKRIVARLRE
jgi:chloramphenicol 3-O phosphotransferase